MIETYRGIVHASQLDHMGHMNIQWYTSKFDEATWHLFATLSITPDYVRQHNKGMVAIEQHVKYHREALAGDLLVIRSELLTARGKMLKFRHIMYNAVTDTALATCEFSGMHMDRITRKSCAFPEEVRERVQNILG